MLNILFSNLNSPFARPLSLRFKGKGYGVLGFSPCSCVGAKALVFFLEGKDGELENLHSIIEALIASEEAIPIFCVSYSNLPKELIDAVSLELKNYPDPTYLIVFPYVFGNGLPLSINPEMDRFFRLASRGEDLGPDFKDSYDFVVLTDAVSQIEEMVLSYLEYPIEDDDKPIPPTVFSTLTKGELYSFILTAKGTLGDSKNYLSSLSSPIKRALFAEALPYYSSLPVEEKETDSGFVKEIYKDPDVGQFVVIRFETLYQLGWFTNEKAPIRIGLLKGVVAVKTIENGKLRSVVLSDPLKMVVDIAPGTPRCVEVCKEHSMIVVFSPVLFDFEKEVKPFDITSIPSLHFPEKGNAGKENPYEELDKAKSSYKQADTWGKKKRKK